MTATTQFNVFHGAAPGTPSDITGTLVRYKQADNDAPDTASPISVPTSGNNFSFRKSYKLRVADPVLAVGPDNAIENLRFFSEGQLLGTDRIIIVEPAAVYVQGSVADNTAAFSGTAVDVDGFTTTVPLVVNAGQVFGPGETGDGTQDFVVTQARIGPTAGAGNSAAAKGLNYRYSEL